ncbi:MAG: hypothetical protein HFG27_06580 [Provencibacterium sp.]|jgi:hypothetical protein|nr:hypothetical protein [Provencibacterium sp.]
MLKKLMKYELRATARIFLPFFGALLVLSVLNRIFYSSRVDRMLDTLRQNDKGLPIEIVRILSAVIFVFLICAIFALTVIVMIQRYYKNLLGDEGYLMFTLPVKPWQLITSKMVISGMWLIVSGIVTVLACLLLAAGIEDIVHIFMEIPGALKTADSTQTFHNFLALFEVGILLLVCLCDFILLTYAAITVGQLWSSHKLLGAFGAFLALNTAFQIVTAFVTWAAGTTLDHIDFPGRWANDHAIALIHSGLWVVILWCALLGAVCFILSNQLLQKRLNLE